MAWCCRCQATKHYLNQCWPRSPKPYGVTRPQWVNNGWNCPPWPSRSQNWMFAYFIINLSRSQQFPTSSSQNQVELDERVTGHFMHWLRHWNQWKLNKVADNLLFIKIGIKIEQEENVIENIICKNLVYFVHISSQHVHTAVEEPGWPGGTYYGNKHDKCMEYMMVCIRYTVSMSFTKKNSILIQISL